MAKHYAGESSEYSTLATKDEEVRRLKLAELNRRLMEMTNGVQRQREFIQLTAPLESSIRGIYTVNHPELRAAKEALAEHFNQQIVEAEKKITMYIITQATEIADAFEALENRIDEQNVIIEDLHQALNPEGR